MIKRNSFSLSNIPEPLEFQLLLWPGIFHFTEFTESYSTNGVVLIHYTPNGNMRIGKFLKERKDIFFI